MAVSCIGFAKVDGPVPAAVLALVLYAVACTADTGPEPGSWPGVPSTWGSSNIRDWYAPDDGSILIRTHGHGTFRGTFMSNCVGIRSTETVGFSTQGPYELDPSTLIVLPDGKRCALRELVPYREEKD